MKAKVIADFAAQFGVQIALNTELITEKTGRFYLINGSLKPFLQRDFYYVGMFLGKVKEGKFFPSFNLLNMLASQEANRIVLDRKAAWLFICGRDILAQSIVRYYGSAKKHTNTLVLNEHGECLGFGRIVGKLSADAANDELAVRHVSDVGDFLRRERF